MVTSYFKVSSFDTMKSSFTDTTITVLVPSELAVISVLVVSEVAVQVRMKVVSKSG